MAAPFEQRGVAQGTKDFGTGNDFSEGLLVDVANFDGEVAAGKHAADSVDEEDSASCQTPFGRRSESTSWGESLLLTPAGALGADALCLRCASCADLKVASGCLCVEDGEKTFDVGSVETNAWRQIDTASDRDEQEDVDSTGVELLGEVEHGDCVVSVFACEGDVDLDVNTCVTQGADAGDGLVEGAGLTAEGVMNVGAGAV